VPISTARSARFVRSLAVSSLVFAAPHRAPMSAYWTLISNPVLLVSTSSTPHSYP